MTTSPVSRRGFLAATGLAAAAVAASGLVGRSPLAFAADGQTDLSNLVDLRFGMFNHFNLGTFTDEEWAAGGQSPAKFAPPSVDCAQWAAAAAAAKMSYGVLTTKHHDGFSLWPTAFGTQNVAYSGYRRDVVSQYVDAFRAQGLRVGLYYSIWDRTHTIEAYGGHVGDSTKSIEPGDMTVVLGQIRELLTNYGTIDVFVTDGYAWQMGQQQISYQEVRNLVKSLQPDCVMVDHGGLSQPWLGDAIYFEAPLGVRSPAGNTYAGIQGETISNGWFWHPSTPTTAPRSLDGILADLKDLEPKYTSYLLNCPPNRDGKLDTNIVNRLAEVGAAWSPNSSRPPLPAQPLRVEWPVNAVAAYASSYNPGEFAYHAIDNRSDVRFETCWSTWGENRALSQTITIDLGGVWSNVSTLEYLPKQWRRSNSTDGDITAATISTSTDGIDFTTVATVRWAADQRLKLAEWGNRDVGFVRVHVTEATGGYANINGLHIGGRSARPQLVSRFPAAKTVYRIQSAASGKVLDVQRVGTADNTPVHQWSWLNQANQKWTFISTGDGYFKIRDEHSGKLLEVGGLSRANGGTMNIWRDANVHQQHWAVTPVGGDHFLLTNRFSQRVLQVPDASTEDGKILEQWDHTGASHQQWRLVRS
ncbi:alpha-L-fucosidase [Saccharothrix ecbatanensis]|uniref:alpha-L-fucosidase n=1 Tax=Saccharothrix ecbatanensis TaxID=1105145 RepID=A0A7W9HJL8_9PSEU|nr:alpha-L-fucosidase [Saccharothrix ecbatanensis]MBB5803493.1 alpha-L-fucosidase [Saccharothrix ecbatanensis]